MALTFRQAFKKFVDTQLYSRFELSEIFHVAVAEIDGWVDGTAIPSSGNMRGLHGIMKEDERFPLAEFNEMMEAPVMESLSDCKLEKKDCPKEIIWGSNLRNYSLQPMRHGLMEMFKVLPCDEQERLASEFSTAMWKSFKKTRRNPTGVLK